MTDDPFLELVCDALGLMNKAVMYPPSDRWPFGGPGSGQLFAQEFYHQFRKLWDRAILVVVGLGHLVFRQETALDLAIFRRPETGGPDEPFAVFGFTSTAWKPDERPVFGPIVDTVLGIADGTQKNVGFRYAVVVTLGPPPEIEPPATVTHINFDLDRWTATVIET